MIRVTVWNEFFHEKMPEFLEVAPFYKDGIHETIAKFLKTDEEFEVRVATLDMPEHGLTDEVLENTDVLFWWAHMAHDKVDDAIVEKIYDRVLNGMGLILLHSAHYSKIFKKLMGTTCSLRWRETEQDRERVWTIDYSHPIAQGLPDYFELPHTEMYGEIFDIPKPDDIVFISWYAGGEVFRSGVTYQRGKGKVFYFSPGHETFPIYEDPNIQQILKNAAKWAAPAKNDIRVMTTCINMAEAPEFKK